MSERFDELTRQMAAPRSRRGALKIFGADVGGATVATFLKPSRADAACPPGETQCGTACCNGTCTDPNTSCCCAPGTTPCGSTCCQKGIACADARSGTCGCPAGQTPCGTGANLTCCAAGTVCSPSNSTCVPAATTGTAVGCGCSTCGRYTCANSDLPCGNTTYGGKSATRCAEPCFVSQTTDGCACVNTQTVPYCNFDCDPNTACPSGQTCIACCGSGYTCTPVC